MTLNTDSQTAPAPYKNDPRIEKDAQGTWHVRGYAEARDLLKEDMIQDGFNADELRKAGFDGVLYMSGDPHRQMRAAIAKYFSPTTVQNTHMAVIEKTADELISDLKAQKNINLKILTRRMAAIIASVVIGLTPTNEMVQRIDNMLHSPKLSGNPVVAFIQTLQGHYRRFSFFFLDVMPAIRSRRKSPQNDVISYMLSKEKRPLDILVECIVYGAAGMATTQEFILVVLLHCMKDAKLREIMLSDNTAARYEALNEILRLEPVIANIYRLPKEAVNVKSEDREVTIQPGERIAFHLYDVNVDAKAAGDAPEKLNPHRNLEKGVYRSMMGFGSGPHRCAGEHLALAETDVFIQKLLKLPGLRIESGPDIIRNDTVEGYEVNDLIVAVD
ncbi:MAG: cytochrome P450 [Anaerolineales bacterium]|nr:cytochrome P450 [Anaerolineales bacterium]